MKFLKIHKAIWFILVLLYTLGEAAFVLIGCITYMIWNFKYPGFNAFWKEYQERMDIVVDDKNEIISFVSTDSDIIDTIIRRYNFN